MEPFELVAGDKASRKAVEDGSDGIVALVPLVPSQRALFDGLDCERGGALMDALDTSNRRWARGAVVPGTAGFGSQRNWSTRFDMRSPRYTTRIIDIPVVGAACARKSGRDITVF